LKMFRTRNRENSEAKKSGDCINNDFTKRLENILDDKIDKGEIAHLPKNVSYDGYPLLQNIKVNGAPVNIPKADGYMVSADLINIDNQKFFLANPNQIKKNLAKTYPRCEVSVHLIPSGEFKGKEYYNCINTKLCYGRKLEHNISCGAALIGFGRGGFHRDTGLVYVVHERKSLKEKKPLSINKDEKRYFEVNEEPQKNISGGAAAVNFGRGGLDRDTGLVYAIFKEKFDDSKIYDTTK